MNNLIALANAMKDPMWVEFIIWCQERQLKNDSKAFEAFMSEKKSEKEAA